jgi:hypothetical protein
VLYPSPSSWLGHLTCRTFGELPPNINLNSDLAFMTTKLAIGYVQAVLILLTILCIIQYRSEFQYDRPIEISANSFVIEKEETHRTPKHLVCSSSHN